MRSKLPLNMAEFLRHVVVKQDGGGPVAGTSRRRGEKKRGNEGGGRNRTDGRGSGGQWCRFGVAQVITGTGQWSAEELKEGQVAKQTTVKGGGSGTETLREKAI